MDASAPSSRVSPPGRPIGLDNRRGANVRIVMRDVGALQVLLGLAMLLPLLISLLYREIYTALSFLAAAMVTAAFGAWAYRTCRDAGEPDRRHAMLIAAVGWLVSAVFGSLPFLLAAYWTPREVAQAFVPQGETYVSSLYFFRNPLHAFFESMSGFTTTGLSMAVHEPSVGRGLLFYRSLTQWVGGAGVIVLSLAIVPRPHLAGALELYQSETTGTKIRPSILGTARAIWKVYTGLLVLMTLYLFVAIQIVLPEYGRVESLYDAVNHAMAGLATGGFSPLDDSIAGYGSYVLEMAHLLPMVLGAISLPLYYSFLQKRNLRVFWQDPQFRSMCYIIACGVVLLAVLLMGTPAVEDPIREGVFQFVSGLSGTGWQTSDIAGWGNAALLLVAWGAMIVSGAAGSTVGGIKLIRAYLLSRAVVWRVRKVFLPSDAVVPFRVGDRSLVAGAMQREVADAAVLAFLYIAILAASVLAAAYLAAPQFGLGAVIFECASAQGTVGLSTGITDPGMPAALECLFIFQMWVGRLEIFPVIVLLTAPFSAKGKL